MDKRYDGKNVESKWQKYWETQKIYKFDEKSKKKVFSIDVPPPYASSGHLHIGHALHYTQFEIIARYKRQRGFNVYFAPCFDNNGLPTEKYVEEKYNISKEKTTRSEFRKLCKEEAKKVEKDYADRVFKTLGYSYDWSLVYTTIDTEAQEVCQRSFIDLYKKGLAYRAEEPVLWCTKHQTALAQAEIEDKERKTKLNYINFDLENSEKITIATTRPELLGACVGIFVNPNDKRHKHLIGKLAKVPLFHHEVPIMADEKVESGFGTGIVMICTFGDKTDVEWWKKHKLPLRNCLNSDGRLNEENGNYSGLTLKEARIAVIEDLEKENRLKKQEEIEQTVGTCWRCNTPIEFLVAMQWFIKTLDYKKELLDQGKKIKWFPSFYRKRYEDWVTNLGWDWVISRQRFYGVPMPIWYCKNCGKIIVADEKDLPVDPLESKPNKKCTECKGNEFIGEDDVFDTWMTSSMTPQIALRWLKKPKQFTKLFPMDYRAQSHDIIRTWAFYTILKSHFHFKKIPWKNIAIGTFVLDEKGKGMHKSKGNAVWVDELLKNHDVDTIRFWVGTAKWGEDLRYSEKDLIAGQRFLTKLWNSARFSFMHLEGYKLKKVKLESFDKWILNKLSDMIKKYEGFFDKYDSSESKKVLEQFFWHDFCDNYLEIIKDRIYNEKNRGKVKKQAAQFALYQSLLAVLKLSAPMMPHVTEEIYHNYFAKLEKKKSIHISDWPKINIVDKTIVKDGDLAMDIISRVRQFKTKQQKSLKEPVKLVINKKLKIKLKPFLEDLKATVNATEISFGDKFKISF